MTARAITDGGLRTVTGLLRRAAEVNADAEAYVEPAIGGARPQGEGGGPGPHAAAARIRRRLTFGAWDRAADGLAGLFAAAGVGRGDVVGLLLPSSIDYAVAYAAAARLGAITSGMNPRLGQAELDSITDRARPILTVVDEALGVRLAASAGRLVGRDEAARAWAGTPPASLPALHEDDAVAVVWTSGTTGRPKGAVFDHRCLAAVAAGADVLSRTGDRRLSPLPFAHVGSMTKVWDEIAHCITTVITPTPWRADEAIDVMEAERVSVAQGVPTQWALMLESPRLDVADLSSLRVAGTGAAPMAASMVAEIRRRLGVPVVVRYASTETAICTGTVPEDRDEVVATTVGRPVPGVALEVVGEDGRPVGPGETGRVRIRSAAVMRGYWRDRSGDREPLTSGSVGVIDASETAAVLDAEGWVTTGDFGVLDEEGNLRLVGREHERYIRGGYNVYPVEVEEVLASHPGVARAAVVGAPDPVLGEVGVAFVVPAATVRGGERDAAPPTLEEVRAWCGATLADYKAPDAVVLVPELPLTPMMKVDKRALSADAARAAAARPRRGSAGVAARPHRAGPGPAAPTASRAQDGPAPTPKEHA